MDGERGPLGLAAPRGVFVRQAQEAPLAPDDAHAGRLADGRLQARERAPGQVQRLGPGGQDVGAGAFVRLLQGVERQPVALRAGQRVQLDLRGVARRRGLRGGTCLVEPLIFFPPRIM